MKTLTRLQASFALVTQDQPNEVARGIIYTTQPCQHIADDQTAFLLTLEQRFGPIKDLYLVIRTK